MPAAWPSTGGYVAGAYESTRGKVFLFLHDAGSTNAELWDWDGNASTFTQRTPCSFVGALTPVQSGFSAAFDPMRRLVVIYGAVQDLARDVATFEFDPETGALTDRTPANPAFNWPREQPLMFFDESLGSVVVYGPPNLWSWDPSAGTWTLAKTITSMGPRGIIYSIVYDGARHKLYAFHEGVGRADVSELDLTSGQWALRTPSPLPTEWPALANVVNAGFDAKRDRMVLFGTSSSAVHATWEWEPATGMAHSFLSPSADAMPTGGEVVYDGSSGHVTVDALRASGLAPNDGYLNDVWTWDGAKWTSNRPKHVTLPWPAQGWLEPNEPSFALAYDSDRKRTVLFQHPRSYEAKGTTLEWDGTTWIDRTPPDPAPSPPARFGHALTYDASRGKTVLFGGVNTDRPRDVWEWDGVAWTNRTPTPLPSSWPIGRSRPGLTYDPTTRTVLLFGGESDDDTWSWDGATGTWSRPPSSVLGFGPSSPRASALAYDDRLGAAVLIDYRFDAFEASRFSLERGPWQSLPPPAGAPPERALCSGSSPPPTTESAARSSCPGRATRVSKCGATTRPRAISPTRRPCRCRSTGRRPSRSTKWGRWRMTRGAGCSSSCSATAGSSSDPLAEGACAERAARPKSKLWFACAKHRRRVAID